MDKQQLKADIDRFLNTNTGTDYPSLWPLLHIIEKVIPLIEALNEETNS